MAPKAKAVAKAAEVKPAVAVGTVKRKASKSPPRAASPAKDDKKAKTAEPKEEKKEEEPVEVEQEKDAPAAKGPLLKDNVTFDPMDCTLNVLPAMQGKVLMSLSDGGMQFLLAGARANVGIKSGRYMFECKVVEALNPAESAGNKGKVPLPRQVLRMGFSTSGSQLILGESEDGVCFDAEGFFTAEKTKTAASTRFGKNQTMGVLLNLDAKSPNYNTISLFHNGARTSKPQALPEALKGKTLYPHVCYRSVSVQMHFGSEPLVALPFKCRTLQTATATDVEVRKPSLPKDGKYEVMFPVAFPDEGTFDWLDTFLDKNPHYVELSDRTIIDWAGKSGMIKPKGNSTSNDRPEFNYGLTAMDDMSCRRVLQAVAPLVPRNYVVMEVKENLSADDRAAALKRFPKHSYKRVAHVVLGEPNDEYKKVVHSRILKEKRDKVEAEWKAKKAELERKRQAKDRLKQLAELRKKAAEAKKKEEAEKKKKAEEMLKKKKEEKEAAENKRKEIIAKKKAEAAEKAKEAAAAKKAAEDGEKKEGEDAEMEDAEAKAKEEAEAAEKAKEEAEAQKAKEEAEAEKAKEEAEAAKAKEEAEAEQEAEAEKAKEEAEAADKAKEEEEKKKDEEEMNEPMPEVELSEEDKKVWFRKPAVSDITSQVMNGAFGKFTIPQKTEDFDDIRYEWQGAEKANTYLRTWVLEKKLSSRIEDLTPSAWFKEKHAAFTKSLKAWQDKQKPFQAKKKEEEKKKAKAAADEEEEEEDKGADLDIFAVEDICDIGEGEPLFGNFNFEDWSLLTLRYELFLLIKAFMHDCDDEERVGIHETNLQFYYNKYFHKQLTPKLFGKESNSDVVNMVKDTVTLCKDSSVLKSDLSSDEDALDVFVKLTEEGRRERQRRIDAGDETAKIKFNPQINTVSKPVVAKPVIAKPAVTGTGTLIKPAGVQSGLRPTVGGIRPAFGAARPWGAPQW